MKAPFSQPRLFDTPRVAMWRRQNCVARRRLPVRVMVQVLILGQVYFGSW
jgi:hypothetical protein